MSQRVEWWLGRELKFGRGPKSVRLIEHSGFVGEYDTFERGQESAESNSLLMMEGNGKVSNFRAASKEGRRFY